VGKGSKKNEEGAKTCKSAASHRRREKKGVELRREERGQKRRRPRQSKKEKTFDERSCTKKGWVTKGVEGPVTFLGGPSEGERSQPQGDVNALRELKVKLRRRHWTIVGRIGRWYHRSSAGGITGGDANGVGMVIRRD